MSSRNRTLDGDATTVAVSPAGIDVSFSDPEVGGTSGDVNDSNTGTCIRTDMVPRNSPEIYRKTIKVGVRSSSVARGQTKCLETGTVFLACLTNPVVGQSATGKTLIG